MKIPYIILPVLLILNSCGTRLIRGEIEDASSEAPTTISYADWEIETVVSELSVLVDDMVSVECLVTRRGELLSGIPTTLEVTPSGQANRVAQVNGAYQFSTTQSGSYVFRCKAADDNVVDSSPTTVVFLAGAAVAVETSLASTQVQAGVPVDVSCQSFDTFGNLIEQGVEQTGLVIDEAFEVRTGLREEFVVRGTLIGSYPIACKVGADVLDLTPEILVVSPGAPANSVTSVTPAILRPLETATISCSYTDLYGNAITDVPRVISVLPDISRGASLDGMSLNDNEFSGTSMGSYFAFCSTPGFYAGDETPAEIVVKSGLPYSWSVDMLEQDCYWQDRLIPVSYAIYDFWGNEVEDAVVETTVIPDDGVTIDDNGNIRLSAEAEYSFTVEISSEKHEDSEIEPFVDSLRVDSTPPAIRIESPSRGAMLQEGGLAEHSVSIEGSMTDALSKIIKADINGEDLEASGLESLVDFSATQTSRWGMSVITASSEDECGNVSVHAQSYLRSSQYFPASTTENYSAQANQGMVARLNQPIIDDFDRSTLNDIASLGEAVFQRLDFNTLLAPGQAFVSDPINPSTCSWGQFTSDSGYFIGRDSDGSKRIGANGPWINSLVANDNGIGFDIRVADLSFPLDIWHGTIVCAGIAGVGPAYAAFKGIVGADSVKATGNLGVNATPDGTDVTMDTFELDLDGLYVDVDCGIMSWFCNGILNLIISPMTGLIENLLAGVIQNEIPGVLEGVLDGFQIDAGFDLPEPINMTLNINSGFDYSDFSSGNQGNGYGELGLAAQVFPSSRDETVAPDSRGAIQKDGSMPGFSATDYAFGLGLKDDVLNQVMWALWYGGGLSFDNLIEFVSEASAGGGEEQDFSDVISMSLKAELPPVIMPGTGDEEVDIGLGDVWVEAAVDLIGLIGGEATQPTIRVGMYLSSILSGSIDIDPTTNELQVAVADNPEIYVQVVSIDDMGYQALMSDLFARVLKLILPRVFSSVLGSFPLPAFDLSALAGDGLVPPGTVWKLTNGGIERPNDNYYRLSGGLE